jgi:hypothetical protein
MAWNIFAAEITPSGVVVHPPFFGDEDPETEEADDANN